MTEFGPAGTLGSTEKGVNRNEAAVGLVVASVTAGYGRPDGAVDVVVADVSFTLRQGRILGLAGESGSGKTTIALLSTGYRPMGSITLAGASLLGDMDLLRLPPQRLRAQWGRAISYLPQNAGASLNPSLTIGRQLAIPMSTHLRLVRQDIHRRQIELLESVALPDPERALRRYPHQFSGGQQQRIALAIALSCDPQVLILDEPTTGLDVTTQARISELLRELLVKRNLATLYVSHNLGLLAELTDDLAVMYGGEIVEVGPTKTVIRTPTHPYTRALLAAVPSSRREGMIVGISGSPPLTATTDSCSFAPRCAYAVEACRKGHVSLEPVGKDHSARCLRSDDLPGKPQGAERARPRSAIFVGGTVSPLLEVRGLTSTYGHGTAALAAVKDVSFAIAPGETLGIAGESGSGKSTLLRTIAGLHTPTAGSMLLRGEMLPGDVSRRPRNVLRDVQMVFQNPQLALNPRRSALSTIRRTIRLLRSDVSRSQEQKVAEDAMEAVKLPRSLMQRFPAELSGGQQQRVALAAAFAAQPSLLLCDEVTSALDVSVQATILELIAELAREFGTTVLFVSHDLGVVRAIAHRAVIMLAGSIVESGATSSLFDEPTHPYTRELLAAVPELPVD